METFPSHREPASRIIAVVMCVGLVTSCATVVDAPRPRPVVVEAQPVPELGVTRGELASALAEALNLPGSPADYFGDDDASEHEDGINRATAAGFATGCTETEFCPDQVVSRGVIAEFLARGLELPETDEDHFSDDDGTQFEPFINRMAEAGLVEGRDEGGFGPMEPLQENDMLAFLSRARRIVEP